MSAAYDAGPSGWPVFVLVTLVLGGAAALATGRAIAQTWRPLWQVGLYALLLAFAVRFIQYALFAAPLLSAASLTVDALILLALAALGYRHERARQMREQYPWLFAPAGVLGWTALTPISREKARESK